MNKILDLCGGTGSWSKPYAEASAARIAEQAAEIELLRQCVRKWCGIAVEAKARTEAAEAQVRALTTTLRRIADPPKDGCGCEHDTPDCCAFVDPHVYCPECIAWQALAPLASPPRAGTGWQPIETAPKDGTEFDAWCPSAVQRITVRWDGEGWENVNGGWVSERYPSHWMPLPAPPRAASAPPPQTCPSCKREPMCDFCYGHPVYDQTFGDDKVCACGHPYYRHFDGYDDNKPVGCKYCSCETWVAPPPQET